jgi:hypothetical protein
MFFFLTLAAGFPFFLLVQKEPKKTPPIDNTPIAGWFPD